MTLPKDNTMVRRSLSICAFFLPLLLFTAWPEISSANRLSHSQDTQAKPKQESRPPSATSSAIPPTNSTTAKDRAALPLPEALLGHWLIEDSGTQYYINKGKMISIYAGREHNVPFTIESVDEKERKMRIRITAVHFGILTFSPDKNEVSDIGEVAGMRSEKAIIWKYVDDKRQPPPRGINSPVPKEPTLEVTTAPEPVSLLIGDSRSKVYYQGSCPDYEKLPLTRRVYFKTKRDAERAGYKAGKNCP